MTSLADPTTLRARVAMLEASRVAPLLPWIEGLRARLGEVPWPDPSDGGTEARLLLLLETPGPRIRSTGFVSTDNPDGTARNLRRFIAEADLDRRDLFIWNIVPWIIHPPGATNRAPTAAERATGLALVPDLLGRLPHLGAVVLLGRHAAAARPAIGAARPGLPLFEAPHPSPTHVCTSPAIVPRIVSALSAAAACLPALRRARAADGTA